VFHVELRRFPNVARAFNLSAGEVDARIVVPLVRGVAVEFDDRSWPPDKTRLKIYEGPEIAAEDRGLGRGWSLVTREGQDVTARFLDAARALAKEASPEGVLPGFKEEVLEAAGAGSAGLSLRDVAALAARNRAGRRASEALALAEQSVWEMLHDGSLTLVRAGSGDAVPNDEWESVVLAWESWADPGGFRLRSGG
jgi:hypothetical protein